MTYRESYVCGKGFLEEAGIADAEIDAQLLLEYVCHTSRHDMLVNGMRELSEDEEEAYKSCIARRSERIPLQHITGEQDFMGFTFKVNEHVLIPRQDTENLVEETLGILRSGMCVLDMCTGSGCILLSLLALCKGTEGVGADISEAALKVAEENHHSIELQCGRNLPLKFIRSDLFAEVEGCFDVIVSNPPYIASEVIQSLEPEVRLHEPMCALDGDEDGLVFYRRIVNDSSRFLKKGGTLLFEIGYDQSEAVSGLMREAGFERVTVKKDYAGLDRIVYGFLKEEA